MSSRRTTPIVFTLDCGLAWSRRFQWVSGGAGVDLEGWSAEAQIRRSLRSEEALHTLSTDTGEITLDSDGYVQFDLEPADTAEDEPGLVAWDVILYNLEDVPVKRFRGWIILKRTVTRS